jgi:hypothetical protein
MKHGKCLTLAMDEDVLTDCVRGHNPPPPPSRQIIWVGGWMGPRADLRRGGNENPCPCQNS